MAETAPTAPIAPIAPDQGASASPQAPPASGTMHGVGSPALSDKTVVPAIASSTAPASTTLRLELVPPPQAGSGQALFSTDLGRRPPRELGNPPFPPVIVRSDKILGVVESARFWRSRYPQHSLCYFPQCGFDIHDLWDKADIHLDSPDFLRQVLKFITQENINIARNFADTWSRSNPDRVKLVENVVYKPEFPLDIVDQIFPEEDLKLYPREFLWHVANVMRWAMYSVSERMKSSASSTGAVAKAAVNDVSTSDLDIKAMEHKPKLVTGEKQHKPIATHSSGPQLLPQSPFVMNPLPMSDSSFVPPIPAQLPRMGYQNQAVGFAMGRPGNMMSPHMEPAALRNPKGRMARQTSGSYHQAAHQHGWGENTQMPAPGQQSRQPSGVMSAVQSPRFQPQAPMVSPMINAIMPMAQFPQNPAVMSPPALPSQMVYGPMGYGIYGGPPMGAGLPNHAAGGSGPHGMPIGDMTNNAQYPFNPTTQHVDQRVPLSRRSSRADKHPGLYNPYGVERPEFTTVPMQSTNRRGSRSSFSNPPGRNRNLSFNSHHRPSYGQHNVDQQGYPAQLSSRQPEQGHMNHSSTFANPAIDPIITGDREKGCDESWVGPKNTYVNKLIAFGIPPGCKEDSVLAFFQQEGAKVIRVQIGQDKMEKPIAYITFGSPADAAKGLKRNECLLNGHLIAVKVPHGFYSKPREPSRLHRYYSDADAGPPPLARGADMSRRMSQTQPTTRFNGTAPGLPKHTYSPQDARSDLPQQHPPENVTMMGSPDARKSKKHDKSPTKTMKASSETSNKLKEHLSQTESAIVSHAAAPESTVSALAATTPEEANEIQNPAVEPEVAVAEQQVEATVEPIPSIATTPDPMKEDKITTTSPRDNSIAINDTVSPAKPKDGPAQDTSLDDSIAVPATPASPAVIALTESNAQTPAAIESENAAHGTVELDDSATTLVNAAPRNDNTDTLEGETSDQSGPAQQTFNGSAVVDDKPDQTVSVSQGRDELVSDDEQKNDTSFHSAKESQSDTGKLDVSEDTTVGEEPHPIAEQLLITPAEPLGHQVAAPEHGATQDRGNTGNPVTPQEKGKDSTPAAVPQRTAPVGKKSGAKQTESLHPFAQPKAKGKKGRKEKQAKKNARKKEKAEKSGPSATTAEEDDCQDNVESPHATTTHQSQQDSHSTINLSGSSESQEDKDGILPEKITEGKGSVPSEGLLAGTRKEERSGSPMKAPEQEAPNGPEPTGVPSSESRLPMVANQSNLSPPKSNPLEQPNRAPEAQGQAKKSRSAGKVAIPNLKLLPLKQSPSSKGVSSMSSPTETLVAPEDGKKGSSQVKADGVTSGSLGDAVNDSKKLQSAEDEAQIESTQGDAASRASSTTLRAPTPPLMSPSPTAAEFHTPLQTPTALVTPNPEQLKKSKNKRKKKKSAAAATEASAANATGADAEPFSEQMRQIDSLKAAKEDPSAPAAGSSYYQSRDNLAPDAHDAASKEEAREADKQNPLVSTLDDIMAYVKEKTKMYSPLAREPSKYPPHLRPRPVELTFEDLEKIIAGPKKPYGFQALEDDDGSVPVAGEISFFAETPTTPSTTIGKPAEDS